MRTERELCHPEQIGSYFRAEWKPLFLVTVSGIFYNVGLLAGPFFEGKLVQCLLNILEKKDTFFDMLRLVLWYVGTIAAVQMLRYIKRLYVRRFANNVNFRMKQILYGNLVSKSKRELEQEKIGSVMTRAIQDVDACAEGMRKFTTEIFDTGVALLCYVGMLLWYDWRLALLCLIFPPISYVIAEKMKTVVQRTGAKSKESAGRLNGATMDRISNASTYRVFGCEAQRNEDYEKYLTDYEKASVRANIWSSALPPLYHVISMTSVLFLLYFGSRNVMQMGTKNWDIAAFTTFLSCYTKLSVKSSKAAKLFNSVQKAQVSWKRIRPLLNPVKEIQPARTVSPGKLEVSDLGVADENGKPVFEHLSFTASQGQIIGITGPIACGKSMLGKAFLGEFSYQGSIRFDGRELSELTEEELCGIVGYLGHDPELMSDTICSNILLGEEGDADTFLQTVCLDSEVNAMADGRNTRIGDGGVMLSGGQQQRLALARTLAHKKPLLILDDPFSALDRKTEEEVFQNLKKCREDGIILLISHRLYLFPKLDQVIWMENKRAETADHEKLMKSNPLYAELYLTQKGGGSYETQK
ncbi:MAG: ABC transporter ATP-binding protein [Fusicatenibacter sp.]|nr:ABC transporter ATP-binding protein/permease [Fusicatenibacter sp.]